MMMRVLRSVVAGAHLPTPSVDTTSNFLVNLALFLFTGIFGWILPHPVVEDKPFLQRKPGLGKKLPSLMLFIATHNHL